MSADVTALARTLHDYGCGIPDLCELVHRDTTPPRWTVMAQNLLADPGGLLASLADAGVLEAVEEARIHYRYGVNSGTLSARNTPESVAAAVRAHEQATSGPVGVDRVEARTRYEHATRWKETVR